jgi:uncharacterized membrane protein SpoIIM required for sporulation
VSRHGFYIRVAASIIGVILVALLFAFVLIPGFLDAKNDVDDAQRRQQQMQRESQKKQEQLRQICLRQFDAARCPPAP